MKVEIPIHVRKGESSARGWCHSLSIRGLGATLAGDFRVGDLVELRFRLASEDVTISSFVIWKSGLSLGFEFVRLPNSCRQTIESMCGAPEPREEGPVFGQAF